MTIKNIFTVSAPVTR